MEKNKEKENDSGLKMKYFVLNPYSSDKVHREASIYAIIKYAESIKNTDKKRANDLFIWILDIINESTRKNIFHINLNKNTTTNLSLEEKED